MATKYKSRKKQITITKEIDTAIAGILKKYTVYDEADAIKYIIAQGVAAIQEDDDSWLTPEVLLSLKEAEDEIERGEGIEFKSVDKLDSYLRKQVDNGNAAKWEAEGNP